MLLDVTLVLYLYGSVAQNKKQRMFVRQAVLKAKDPRKIIDEMRLIDSQGIYSSNLYDCGCNYGFFLVQRCWNYHKKGLEIVL